MLAAARCAIACALAVGVLAGCGNDAPDALKIASSWSAAAEMTGRAWLESRVPTRYAARTLDSAAKELRSARETPGVPAEAIEAAAAAIGRLRHAVATADRDAARSAVDELTTRGRELARRARELGA